MTVPITSHRKADAVANGLLLIGLGILFYTQAWWPGILLVIWVNVATRQFLTARYYDFAMSTIILVGLFVIMLYKVEWNLLLPILFVLGGIYIIFREYFLPSGPEGEDKAEEIQHDIEDGKPDS